MLKRRAALRTPLPGDDGYGVACFVGTVVIPYSSVYLLQTCLLRRLPVRFALPGVSAFIRYMVMRKLARRPHREG
jgi:hypothetical protein